MNLTINIFEKPNSVVTLQEGRYDIYLSGGSYVSFGMGSHITIRNMNTDEKITLKPTMKIRSRINGFKSVKLFSIDVPKSDDYNVEISFPGNIEVKKSMLSSLNLLMGAPKKSDINLIIQRR
jgi:hypothetical protein